MTGKDNTEEQLLASMRKNKPAAAVAPQQQPAKKTPLRRTSKATRSAPKPAPEPNPGSNYRSGRRVWPD